MTTENVIKIQDARELREMGLPICLSWTKTFPRPQRNSLLRPKKPRPNSISHSVTTVKR